MFPLFYFYSILILCKLGSNMLCCNTYKKGDTLVPRTKLSSPVKASYPKSLNPLWLNFDRINLLKFK